MRTNALSDASSMSQVRTCRYFHALVVEASKSVAHNLRRSLERAGFRVSLAYDARKALRILSQIKMDLIVIDYRLPGMNGDELCSVLRARGDYRTPVIMLANDGDRLLAERARQQSDLAAIFLKPFSMVELMTFARQKCVDRQVPITDEAAPEVGKTDHPAHILVVEDSEPCAYALRRDLRRAGFDVTTAGSGMEAVQLLEHSDIDVVLTDHEMPFVTGSQLCSVLREHPRYRDLPLIMITGKGYELDVQRLKQQYQLAAVLLKPFRIPELIDAINRCRTVANK